MKILFIIDSLGGGGAERSTQVLCNYLYDNDVDFKIVCLYYFPEGFHQEMMDKGYDIQFLSKKSFWGQTKEIASIITDGDYDIVHSILFKSNLRTRFAKLFAQFFHLESLVNSTYSKERFFDENVNARVLKVYKQIDKITAKKFVDHFHGITNSVKNHYVRELDIDPKNISIVYRGRKPVLIDKEQEKNRRFTLLNVARQDYQKGQIYLLQAIDNLVGKGVKDIQLIILGVEGRVTVNLKTFVKERSLEPYVNFAGFSNNVSEYFSMADIFVFSSLFEGLGGALIEAQSARLPIIANDIEVLREVAVDNKNAIFVDIKDTEALAQAILKLKNFPELMTEFSQNSLKNYEEKFREEVSNQEMLKLYKKLC
ncbi:glycosyltransferase family 4 protein [Salegentibacter sp. JZCK2]|uniref:glycosyltransferase family 4 protein n=1 Tax=Salegentibacter tibetensis TaxID=2873600 RepID=UPI001CC8FE0A|nr:glycosyltransferase family 4 protein [Salegentibacter tibetensis]MBZ9729071.1 glycosyltransferase family 4 protein [Salegentibacter tibetensis]